MQSNPLGSEVKQHSWFKSGAHISCFAYAYLSSLPLLPSPLFSLEEPPLSHLKFKWSVGTTLTRISSSHPHVTSLSNGTVHLRGHRDGFRDEHLTHNGPLRLSPGVSAGIIGEGALAPTFGKRETERVSAWSCWG